MLQMIVYVLILIFITLLYPLCGKKRIVIQGKYEKRNNKKYVYIVSLLLIVILGFR